VANNSARPSEKCIAAALSVGSSIAPFRQSLWSGVLEENTLKAGMHWRVVFGSLRESESLGAGRRHGTRGTAAERSDERGTM
jgi:hypothetical protein